MIAIEREERSNKTRRKKVPEQSAVFQFVT